LATTCNNNQQQEVAKNNAELLTKWVKTIRKTCEGSFKRGQNRSFGVHLVTYDDDDDDDDDDICCLSQCEREAVLLL
jgi:hypothetical protein